MRSSIATIAITALLLAAAVASGKAILGDGDFASPDPPTYRHTPRIDVGGHIVGLYPGAARRMPTTVTNHLDHAVRLRSVHVDVLAGAPGCAAGNLVVRRPRNAHRVIRSGHRATVGLRVSMRRSASDACQGARFPLRFKANTVRLRGGAS